VIEGVTGVVGGEEGITWTERCMFYTAVLFMDSCHFSRVGRVHHLAAIFCRTQEKLASMPSPVSAQQPLSAEAERDTERHRETQRDTQAHRMAFRLCGQAGASRCSGVRSRSQRWELTCSSTALT
jgi:hypothetical protein